MSLIVSALIIGILLFPTSIAMSVSVSIEGLQGEEIEQCQTFKFDIDLTIESGERVPISKVRVTVEGPASFTYEFDPIEGGVEPYLKLDKPKTIIDSTPYGYGYAYDYGVFYGYGHTSGYGYGYGFHGPQTLRWRATLINTESLPAGVYKVRVEVESDGVWWGGLPTETTFQIVVSYPVPYLKTVSPLYDDDDTPTMFGKVIYNTNPEDHELEVEVEEFYETEVTLTVCLDGDDVGKIVIDEEGNGKETFDQEFDPDEDTIELKLGEDVVLSTVPEDWASWPAYCPTPP